MASEYYKWLARDVKPEAEKVLTREEKWNNWWYYHKGHVIIGILCLLFAANMGYEVWHNARNKPDYTIAYVGSTPLPDDTAEALEHAFAGLGEDLNGNGMVQVELLTYAMADDQTDSASMLLMLNIETVESMIFLLEDPEGFCAAYPVLAGVDGTMPDETEDDLQRWYRWADCPVLAALELGTFELPLAEGVAGGDSQQVMENICIARRGLWNGESSGTIHGALDLWETMTAGAKKGHPHLPRQSAQPALCGLLFVAFNLIFPYNIPKTTGGTAMSSTIDLHIHTTASDGSDTVQELAAKIAASGIRLFSVTDHDTIDAALEMERFVPEGVRYIRGVEFSCVSPAGKCHILGYGYDPDHPAFRAALEEGRQLRRSKLRRRIDHLREHFGVELTGGELDWLAALKSPGKPHLGKLLVDRGLAPDLSAAIKTFLGGVPGRDRIEAGTAVRAIEAAGGLSVWAHPLGGEGEKRLSPEQFEKQLDHLLSCGIRGLECWYSRYRLEEVRFLLDRAEHHGLTVTGGSDCHGSNKKNLELGQLNAENIPAEGIPLLV